MKDNYKTTTNRRVYKLCRIPIDSGCGYCAPNRGCDRLSRHGGIPRSWKFWSKKSKQWMP